MEEPFMRGRLPVGPEYVDQLEASATAKERLKVVLQESVEKWGKSWLSVKSCPIMCSARRL